MGIVTRHGLHPPNALAISVTGHAAHVPLCTSAIRRLVQTGKLHSPHHKSAWQRPQVGAKDAEYRGKIQAQEPPSGATPAPPRSPKILNPHSIARGPRVRSSGTFVRLRRPKLSTKSGSSALQLKSRIADVCGDEKYACLRPRPWKNASADLGVVGPIGFE